MARIEGFRVKNYRVIRDITLGKLGNTPTNPLTPITAVIGKNGVGKSTLFDAFGFLSDCLKGGVEDACESRSRGGFEKIRSQGKEGSIEFYISYKEDNNTQTITYELEIDIDESGRPYVKKERLRQGRKGQNRGFPFSFLMLNEGRGMAWKGEEEGKKIEEDIEQIDLFRLIERIQRGEEVEESKEIELVELEDTRKLGIATLGALKQHPRISRFRRFIEGWYLSYFTPEDARNLPLTGPQKHLNIHGDNLANVIQFMEREHPHKFQSILEKISSKIPGINKISTEKSADGRLLIRFNDKGFLDPFYVQQMSDGTLKVFAYLILLEDPSPRPFLCIEEPENGIYHKLLETLVQEFREHARQGGSQVFVTTHQPYFVDALEPEEVWLLEKGEDGFSTIKRASEDPLIKNLVSEGLPLGGLWYSDYLDGR
jgi:predicted ATPase